VEKFSGINFNFNHPDLSGSKSRGIDNDQQIQLKSVNDLLCLVSYIDLKTCKQHPFVINAHHLKARQIAAIYKEHWRIELLLKWIKLNLKIKTFLGTSKNAVLTQIWIALYEYLLVAFLNFIAKLGGSMQQVLRVCN